MEFLWTTDVVTINIRRDNVNDNADPVTTTPPRRSLRRSALSELNVDEQQQNELFTQQQPQLQHLQQHHVLNVTTGDVPSTGPVRATSPDEQVILQRGPRKKPLTWSPYEYDKTRLLGPPRELTPEKSPSPRPDISSRLRRRLVMTPEKSHASDDGPGSSGIGESMARRLRSFARQRHQAISTVVTI